jgi:Homeodomain
MIDLIDFHNIDFLVWARLRLNLRLERSVIGNFMNKKLNERRSREILPFFLQFLNDETFKPKKRKRRDGFTPQQLSVLMESFRTNPHPSQALVQQLADHLGTTQFKIKRWFLERSEF